MRAMILAAGRGSRLRPLTDICPKPLLGVRGKPVIVHHLEALARAGIQDVVINVSHLAEKIQEALQDGARWGVTIQYSWEEQALETGGGIFQALPLLGSEPFLLVNGDILTDYPLAHLKSAASEAERSSLAHLVLVPKKPGMASKGDFSLQAEHVICRPGENDFIYSGLARLDPALFAGCTAGTFSLVPLYLRAMALGRLTGAVYSGDWLDIGTPEVYQEVRG